MNKVLLVSVLISAAFASTMLINGGSVFKAFATHPDVPSPGSLLLWAKTDGTLQVTDSTGADAPMGGAGTGVAMFRPPVPVDDTVGWTDYGSPTGRTIDTSNPGIVIISSAPSGTGFQQQGRKLAVTAPFDKIFAIMPLIANDNPHNAVDFASGGIFVADASGKASTCALEGYNGVGGTFIQYFNIDTPATRVLIGPTPSLSVMAVNEPFNDLSTLRMFPIMSSISTISYWRLKDVSSTLSCQWSPDGYSWMTVWSAADTSYLSAPTSVGYFVNGGSVGTGTKVYMIVRGVE